VTPIPTVHLFPEISAKLLELLRSLEPDEWSLPTVSSRRTAKDVVSHLLDGSLRRLSLQRDGYVAGKGAGCPGDCESLLQFLTRINSEWETGTQRLSPMVLTELTAWADPQVAALFASLDPHATAIFPVAWAGEATSENWMDVAREYTEKWHHTQQIFAATGRPSTIMTSRLGRTCYDIFLRALPFTFQHVAAQPGETVQVKIEGEAGGVWQIERLADRWATVEQSRHQPVAAVTFDQDTAWQVFTKRRTAEEFLARFRDFRIEGDPALGQRVLEMVSIMA
jgi:uncharacterized protein (TIGR03083 family)